ncbi:MAG: hypothetical protein ACKOX6_11215 [Bdellovibrio sp.]
MLSLEFPIKFRKKVDAHGETILIKFFEGTWHCVGPYRPASRHLSQKSAKVHVEFTWKNYVLKVIDHLGIITEERKLEPTPPEKPIKGKAWAPPMLPDEEKELAPPAWLPRGLAK